MSREVYNHVQTISSAAGPTGEVSTSGRGLYVGGPASGTGSVGLRLPDGTDALFKNVPAGTIIPVHHRGVHGVTHTSYPTTAKDIVSLS